MSESTPAASSASDVPLDVTMAELNELVQLFNSSDWDGLEVNLRGVHLALGRRDAPKNAVPSHMFVAPDGTQSEPAAPAAPAAPSAAPAAPEPAAPEPTAGTGRRTEVTAPVVGTFWVAPSPGEQPFVQIGDQIEAGQQLAIVEVMKLMSEVSSPVAGRVVEVHAANAELVEFEQVLFVIESDDG